MLLPEAAWMNGVQVHGAHPGNGLRLERVDIARPPRSSVEVRPQGHGSLVRTRWSSGAVITIAGWCEASGGTADASQQAAWSELLGAAGFDGPVEFTFRPRGEGSLYRYELYPESGLEDQAHVAPWFAWSGTFQATLPWAESDVLRSGDYDPTIVGEGAGLAWPLVWPLEWEAADPLAGLLRVAAEGNTASWPALVIEGPITDPVVTNETTGQSISTTAQLGADDTLTIDTLTRRVLLNGSTERPDLIVPETTSWWSLARGDNYLRLSGSGQLAGSTRLIATWRTARLF